MSPQRARRTSRFLQWDLNRDAAAWNAVPHVIQFTFAHFDGKVLLPHVNEGYEIHIPIKGELAFVANDQQYAVRPGQAFFTCPWQEHSAVDDILPPCDCAWIIIQPEHCTPKGELSLTADCDLTEAEQTEMGKLLASHPAALIDGAQDVADVIWQLRNELEHKHAGFAAIARQLVVQLLLYIQRHLQTAQDDSPGIPRGIARAVKRMESDCARDWTQQELCGIAGLGETSLIKWFRAATGRTPRAYRTALRLEEAKRLLKSTDMRVMDVADRLGFYSSAHMANAFNKAYHMSPAQYRKQIRQRVSAGAHLVIRHSMRLMRDAPGIDWRDQINITRFDTPEQFADLFERATGKSPGVMQREIRRELAQSSKSRTRRKR